MRRKEGTDAVNCVYSVVGRVLNSTESGKELLMKRPHIEQELSVRICKELGFICGEVDKDSSSDDWMMMCTRAPRARGVCMKHYQKKYCKKVVVINHA